MKAEPYAAAAAVRRLCFACRRRPVLLCGRERPMPGRDQGRRVRAEEGAGSTQRGGDATSRWPSPWLVKRSQDARGRSRRGALPRQHVQTVARPGQGTPGSEVALVVSPPLTPGHDWPARASRRWASCTILSPSRRTRRASGCRVCTAPRLRQRTCMRPRGRPSSRCGAAPAAPRAWSKA